MKNVLSDANVEPLCVNRETAAAMWCIGVTKFDELVQDKVIPTPVRIGTRAVWDVAALRRAWRKFADESAPDVNPWDRLPKPHGGK